MFSLAQKTVCLIIVFTSFIQLSCKKDKHQDGTNEKNEISLTVDGQTKTVIGIFPRENTIEPKIYCGLTFYPDYTIFALSMAGDNIPFILSCSTKKGSVNGTGDYQIESGSYIEPLSAGTFKTYRINTGTVHIDKSGFANITNQYLQGSFSFTAQENTTQKSVTGTFNIRDGHSR